jgi:hypothetical protein
MMPTSDTSPWIWIIEHLSAVGWPFICVAAWQISKYFDRLTKQASKTVEQIDTLATNHFPHMQDSLIRQDGLLTSMNESLRTIANNSHRRREDF